MRKKKILIHSNHHKLFTGFGKNAKNVLKHLHQSQKYDIVEVANGKPFNDAELAKAPWKCVGSLPLPNQVISEKERKQPEFQRRVGYGYYGIDEIIRQEKPDIYLGAEDIWAFENSQQRKWWSKLSTIIWTTLDSLPILPTAYAIAPTTNLFLTWATFAQKQLNQDGHTNVEMLGGTVNEADFYKLPEKHRLDLRQKYGINKKDFIIGFVFRNQLRKSVPNLLDGYKKFLSDNPKSNAKLLLHTHWGEGWDIPRLLKEKNIDPTYVLTTYFCKNCSEYEIKPFAGQNHNCRFCGAEKSQETTNIINGVDEKQLNEIYNLMDVYCHPFTSGGMEIPIFEAKLCELITLATNYSCGEDGCSTESGGLPLFWTEYREPGTQFIKATTSPDSICEQLTAVFNLDSDEKARQEKLSRQYVLDNYSVAVVCQKLEKIFDSLPFCDWDFNMADEPRNPAYLPSPNIPEDADFLLDIYKNILRCELDKSDQGVQHWLEQLKNGQTREHILNVFKNVAVKENQEQNKLKFEDLFDDTDKGKRIAIVMPGDSSQVLLANSLLQGLKEKYPTYNLYFVTNPSFFPLVDSNPYLYKCIPYTPTCEDILTLEGFGKHEGLFDLVFSPFLLKKHNTYTHNSLV